MENTKNENQAEPKDSAIFLSLCQRNACKADRFCVGMV